MTLTYEILKDKILGCWNGKNAGGVLGAPYEECPRMTHDVKFYAQDLHGNPPGNDDVDLQLVFLNAVEKFGKRTDSHILADYWLSHIIPNWSEYGLAKRNLRSGILPPLSGYLDNPYKDSNGAWIRTELWACMAPGHPDVAVRYAYEDAIVDHADEGVYSTVFTAALESAAFVESDIKKLIEIALTYIPEDCLTAKAVRLVMDAYSAGKSWKEARAALFLEYPGTFGVTYVKYNELSSEFPNGDPGMDAPNSMGIVTIGLLFGEGDFAKAICTTVNCGEDTDCTAATIGAIYGIVMGCAALPEEWLEPLDGVINTCCVDLATNIPLPHTTEELTDRVVRCIPVMLDRKYVNFELGGVSVEALDSLACPPTYEYIPHISGNKKDKSLSVGELVALSPFSVRYETESLGVILDYVSEPYIALGETKTLRLTVWDMNLFNTPGEWAEVRIYADPGVALPEGGVVSAPLMSTYKTRTVIDVPVTLESATAPKVNVVFDISVVGRSSNVTLKATLFPGKHKTV
jgi:ADP-ribosylglycohydrolase